MFASAEKELFLASINSIFDIDAKDIKRIGNNWKLSFNGYDEAEKMQTNLRLLIQSPVASSSSSSSLSKVVEITNVDMAYLADTTGLSLPKELNATSSLLEHIDNVNAEKGLGQLKPFPAGKITTSVEIGQIESYYVGHSEADLRKPISEEKATAVAKLSMLLRTNIKNIVLSQGSKSYQFFFEDAQLKDPFISQLKLYGITFLSASSYVRNKSACVDVTIEDSLALFSMAEISTDSLLDASSVNISSASSSSSSTSSSSSSSSSSSTPSSTSASYDLAQSTPSTISSAGCNPEDKMCYSKTPSIYPEELDDDEHIEEFSFDKYTQLSKLNQKLGTKVQDFNYNTSSQRCSFTFTEYSELEKFTDILDNNNFSKWSRFLNQDSKTFHLYLSISDAQKLFTSLETTKLGEPVKPTDCIETTPAATTPTSTTVANPNPATSEINRLFGCFLTEIFKENDVLGLQFKDFSNTTALDAMLDIKYFNCRDYIISFPVSEVKPLLDKLTAKGISQDAKQTIASIAFS